MGSGGRYRLSASIAGQRRWILTDSVRPLDGLWPFPAGRVFPRGIRRRRERLAGWTACDGRAAGMRFPATTGMLLPRSCVAWNYGQFSSDKQGKGRAAHGERRVTLLLVVNDFSYYQKGAWSTGNKIISHLRAKFYFSIFYYIIYILNFNSS